MARPDGSASPACEGMWPRIDFRIMRRAGFIMLFVFAGVSAAYAAVEVKTGKLNFTGTGAPLTGAPTGASINVTAGKILFTGTREPLTAPTGTSGPVEVRTPGISFNGTNSM